MTYQEFKNKYNGKFVDYDGYYGNQCWDLGQQYFTECLGLPPSILSGCGLVSNMLYEPKKSLMLQYFDEVSVYEMNPGDVCVWEYGHIAIFDNYDGNFNNFFSQNYPLNSNSHIQRITEGGLHVFRIKGKETKVTPTVTKNLTRTQIEVKVDNLRVRDCASLSGKVIGTASLGLYDVISSESADGYDWYRIADNQWVAYNEDWETIHWGWNKGDKVVLPNELEILDLCIKDKTIKVHIGDVDVWLLAEAFKKVE